VEVYLGSSTNEAEFIEKVNSIPFKGGNTMTGDALKYLSKTSDRWRQHFNIPKILILITDGRPQDLIKIRLQ